MNKPNRISPRLVILVTLLGLCLFMPAPEGSGGTSLLGVGDACAQTGTCKVSMNDICFVNGNGYAHRQWIEAP